MVKVRGRSEVRAYLAKLPEEIERKLLRGAGRAAANVIADEARERSLSSEVRGAIAVRVRSSEGRIVARVQVRGKGSYIAPWLEYGTEPHFISVDASQSEGKTARRINKLAKQGSLVIGGKFVGATVFHPGARPHPFLRPALDTKGSAAIAAAQGYVNARVRPSRITGAADVEDDDQ